MPARTPLNGAPLAGRRSLPACLLSHRAGHVCCALGPPQERTRRRLLLLAEACQVDTEAASAALARAYHAVTRDGVLR